MVVTPPAAALRVDQMKSSWPFWLRLCTWASIAPGSTKNPAPPCFSPAGGAPEPTRCTKPSPTST